MKTKFITALILLGLVKLSFGQQNLTTNQIADFQQKIMMEELNLTQEQKVALEPINLKFAEKQKELIDREGSMLGKIGDFKKLKKEKNSELKKILTQEQMEKYKDEVEPKIKKYMRKNMSR
ncbi:MAG: hypothetical protein ACWA5P_06345 [bacterium]